MVIDLTEDSSDDGRDVEAEQASVAIQTSPKSLDVLLATFQKRQSPKSEPRISTPPTQKNGTYANSVSSGGSSRISPGKYGRVAVIVPQKSSSTETESLSGRKRRLGSEVSGGSEPTSFPDHHGLSEFYEPKERCMEPYRRAKAVDRSVLRLQSSTGTGFFPTKKLKSTAQADLRALYEKKLSAITGPPVTINWDGQTSTVDFNFEFINEYKLHDGVQRVDPNFNAGCECRDGDCDPMQCSCLSLRVSSDRRVVPYKLGRDGVTVLRPDFMKRRTPAMIYECSSLCSCDENCWNRVVQRGRTVRLQIFQTSNRGFGLRTLDDIQMGQYIDSYLGEVVTDKEARERESAANNSASYLFGLDFFTEDDVYVVDGRKYGSVTRFINHSCNPNCKLFSVTQHHADERIFDMAFFAVKDIPAGTELTFDYCPSLSLSPTKPDPHAVKCLCGSANCRGQLWPNQRKTMQVDQQE